MKVYSLKQTQLLPCSIEEAWDFFSSPKNLKKITPSYMDFRITSEDVKSGMYKGQVITYKVKPVLGIPLNWMTIITEVVDQQYFVDEQRFGPYKLWHHKHFFEETKDGVLMTDLVHYALPLGFIGRIAHFLFVKKQLKSIFDYRVSAVEKLFGAA